MAETFSVRAEPIDGSEAAVLIRAYIAEVVGRYWGRDATDEEVDAELAADPNGGLVPPNGTFLILREGDQAVGCAGLQSLEPGIVELKRMFVAKQVRGRGAGRVLVAALEEAARGLDATVIRLDTRHDLVEAIGLYLATGFVDVPAHNEDPYAERWFEKRL